MTEPVYLHLDVSGPDGLARLTTAASYIGEQGIDATFTNPFMMQMTVPESMGDMDIKFWNRVISYQHYPNFLGPGKPEEHWIDVKFASATDATIFKLRFSDWLFDIQRKIEVAKEEYAESLQIRIDSMLGEMMVTMRQMGEDPVEHIDALVKKWKENP
ncbi:hypothetical protein ACIQW5_10460 [Methylorubrum thiocyanatum]|uniref:hypothetical protein n=1 Tax=Methylorubrum thiocyanatum TaxID=47958 RepID=UPI00383AF087